jgi:elongation factor Ts
MAISAAVVQALRKSTGAGMMDCKRALEEADGDQEKATDILRKTGTMKAAKREGRDAREGIIYSYIHMGGKIGVMLELNSETDFVARTDEFQNLAKDVAMHIAASNPEALSREEVNSDLVAKEKEIYTEQAIASGKPEKVVEKIVEGRLDKFFQDVCLLEQPFVKDNDKTIGTLIKELAGKLGENVHISRFSRFQLGE